MPDMVPDTLLELISPKESFISQPVFTCLKLTIETLEQVNFEHISHLVLVLTLNI